MRELTNAPSLFSRYRFPRNTCTSDIEMEKIVHTIEKPAINHQKLFSFFPPLSNISSYVFRVGIMVGVIIAMLIKSHMKKTPIKFKSETELLQISTTIFTIFALVGKKRSSAITMIRSHARSKTL